MLGHSLILFIQHDANLNNYSADSTELLFVRKLFAYHPFVLLTCFTWLWAFYWNSTWSKLMCTWVIIIMKVANSPHWLDCESNNRCRLMIIISVIQFSIPTSPLSFRSFADALPPEGEQMSRIARELLLCFFFNLSHLLIYFNGLKLIIREYIRKTFEFFKCWHCSWSGAILSGLRKPLTKLIEMKTIGIWI